MRPRRQVPRPPRRADARASATSASVRPGSSADASCRASGTANTAPMLARTALGPNGSAQSGPERDASGAERRRRAQHRADVARVVDAVQVHAQRPGRRRRPALLVDGQRARARGQPGGGRQQLGLDLGPVQPAARRAVALDGGPPAASAAASRSSPSATNRPRALAVAPARAELADLLELLVVGAGDRHLEEQKGRPPRWSGARVAVLVVGGLTVSRPPAPRGRGRQSVGRCRRRGRRCRPGSCGRARPRPAAARA